MAAAEPCYLRLRLSCAINPSKSGSCRRGDGGFGEVTLHGVYEMPEEKVLGRRRVTDWGRGQEWKKQTLAILKLSYASPLSITS